MPPLSRPEPPPPTAWVLRGFANYSTRYLARSFHAVRLLGAVPVVPPERPLVIYLNHPSWWDPLICLLLATRFFSKRQSYGPIDAAMLARYRFMRRLGFFGVEQGTHRGAADFLYASHIILSRPGSALWLTPQGRFADPRERPVRFAAGLAHLAEREPGAVYLPLALEYTFWTERTPEALIHFGAPATGPEDLEPALQQAQDTLAAAAIRRQPEEWSSVLVGAAGEGGIYEIWRRARAWWKGEAFVREHGARDR